MIRRVRSKSRGRGDGEESSSVAETVAPSENQEEPPTESQEVEPGVEGEGGVPVVDNEEKLKLEGDAPEMVLEKTGGERGDGPDVKAKPPPPNPE
uniref:GAGE domain-containing protein n=1 Tax=Propithecus coquereli TaxID=379532 RepID=A0A2K6EG54_PROCO